MPSWSEIQREVLETIQPGNLDIIRRKYVKKLAEYTERNVVVYYSSWLNGKITNIDINDTDMVGLMNAIHGLDVSKGLDLVIHSPGGSPTATENIVKYLHSKFGNNIRAIIPHMAMSAGTLMACATQMIFMGKQSCLGPVDPQFFGIPAHNILEEIDAARKELSKDSSKVEYWRLQFSKYPPAFFYIVNDAIKLSKELLSTWLKEYMFSGETGKNINKIVNEFCKNNKSHSKPFNYDKCKELGLKVTLLEDDQKLQDLVLSVYHCFTITDQSTLVSKIIENQLGKAYIINQQIQQNIKR